MTTQPELAAEPPSQTQRYYVVPLSVQREGDLFLVGNADLGDFYQLPQEGVTVIETLQEGGTAAQAKARLRDGREDVFDVDGFIEQLEALGLVHPEDRRQQAQEAIRATKLARRHVFDVDPAVAKAVFSVPGLVCLLGVAGYAAVSAALDPGLRVNFNAFYIDTNRSALLLLILILSLIPLAMHEVGHMLAAARHGVRSSYGIGNRLWNIVAESDITGIMALPKGKRYLPLLAGMLIDVLSLSLLTILIQAMRRHGAGPFAVQVAQALVLQLVLAMIWQFNVFVKTDIYYVLCNWFSYPDLDRDARAYLRGLLHAATFGRLGARDAVAKDHRRLGVLRLFSAIWVCGRLMSIAMLFTVFVPTMLRYVSSAIHSLDGPSPSVWMAVDTMLYVAMALTMIGTGMYMWVKQR